MNGRRSGSTRGKLIASIPGWFGGRGVVSLCGDIIFRLASRVEMLEVEVGVGALTERAELLHTPALCPYHMVQISRLVSFPALRSN